MKKPCTVIFVIWFLVFPSNNQAGVSGDSEIKNISVEDGLSSSSVNSIIQDKKGFLWIGTENGLNRYDGYNFKVYRNIRGDKNSLSNNFIWSLCEDDSGYIWIGTDGGGLNKFNPVTEEFVRFSHNNENPHSISSDALKCVFVDSRNNLWIGSWGGGLNLLNRSNKSFTRYYTGDDSLGKGLKVFNIFEDSKNNIWVGTDERGLNKLEKQTGTLTRYGKFNTASDIIETTDGSIWVGTNGDGLQRLNTTDNTFSAYTKNIPPHIQKIFCDSQGLIWCPSSVGEEPGIYDTNIEQALPVDIVKKLIPVNDVRTFFEDNQGNLWTGTVGEGILKIDRKKKYFRQVKKLKDNFVFSLEEDPAENIWIGTYYGGLNIYDPADEKILTFNLWQSFSNNETKPIIRYLFKDSSSDIWIGAYYGQLTRVDFPGMKKEYFNLDFDNTNPNANLVRTIYEDGNGIIWFGSLGSGGLTSYNKTNGKFNHFSSQTDEIKLSGDDVTSITRDDQNNLWIGTYSFGLNGYDTETGRIKYFTRDENNPNSLPDNKITELYTDKNNNLWIGTYSGGLCKYNYATEGFELITESSGLASNSIFGILEDGQNNLWLSTSRGISRFNYLTNEIINFDHLDGIQRGEFNSSAALKTQNGLMYFGGIEGVTFFNPDSIRDFNEAYPVVFTSFQVFNEEIDRIKNITYSRSLTLEYFQNIFSVEFACLDYTAPDRIEYAYKLEGFNEEWIKNGNRRFANFTHLDPGKYVFKVKSTNSHKVWNETPALLEITILPPFWLTWWFRLISLGAFSGMVLFLYKRRTNQLKREREIQVDFSKRLIQSQEEERKRIAGELHDSLGQDLIVIKNIAMINKKMNEHFEEIAGTAGTAIEEVRRISYNLHPHQLDSLGLTKAIIAMIENLGASTEIKFTSAIDDIDGLLSMEKEISVYRVVQENLNNIIKHSNAEKAFVMISAEDKILKIDIRDNGKGFNFVETLKNSAGFGLKNLANRINLLGGKIDYNSSAEYSVIIIIKIPLENGKN